MRSHHSECKRISDNEDALVGRAPETVSEFLSSPRSRHGPVKVAEILVHTVGQGDYLHRGFVPAYHVKIQSNRSFRYCPFYIVHPSDYLSMRRYHLVISSDKAGIIARPITAVHSVSPSGWVLKMGLRKGTKTVTMSNNMDIRTAATR